MGFKEISVGILNQIYDHSTHSIDIVTYHLIHLTDHTNIYIPNLCTCDLCIMYLLCTCTCIIYVLDYCSAMNFITAVYYMYTYIEIEVLFDFNDGNEYIFALL